jgi:hypothetical protein
VTDSLALISHEVGLQRVRVVPVQTGTNHTGAPTEPPGGVRGGCVSTAGRTQ